MLTALILCAFLASSFVQANPLTLTVYYESLCPYSKAYIKEQVWPTWQKIGGEHMFLDFVPYGKATHVPNGAGGYTFQCHHGPEECYGNKVQACVLDLLTKHEALKVKFIACLMGSDDPPSAGSQCAQTLGVDYTPIQNCANSVMGDQLLAQLGDRTHTASPPVLGFPRTYFNGVWDYDDNVSARNDLLQTVCRKLTYPKPSVC